MLVYAAALGSVSGKWRKAGTAPAPAPGTGGAPRAYIAEGPAARLRGGDPAGQAQHRQRRL